MWLRLPLLVACWAVTGLGALEPDRDAPRGARDPEGRRGAEQQSPGRDAPAAAAEPLDEELDNQENIISQVGDVIPAHSEQYYTQEWIIIIYLHSLFVFNFECNLFIIILISPLLVILGSWSEPRVMCVVLCVYLNITCTNTHNWNTNRESTYCYDVENCIFKK